VRAPAPCTRLLYRNTHLSDRSAMPLVKVKVQKLKPSAKNQVFAGRTSTSVASQVADILELPLIRAAASVLLLIFETVDVRPFPRRRP
jgi:hypothetical protein